MKDFIKMMLLVIIMAQLFWIGSILQKIYEERTIRVTEIKHYAIDIASYGTVNVPDDM